MQKNAFGLPKVKFSARDWVS